MGRLLCRPNIPMDKIRDPKKSAQLGRNFQIWRLLFSNSKGRIRRNWCLINSHIFRWYDPTIWWLSRNGPNSLVYRNLHCQAGDCSHLSIHCLQSKNQNRLYYPLEKCNTHSWSIWRLWMEEPLNNQNPKAPGLLDSLNTELKLIQFLKNLFQISFWLH